MQFPITAILPELRATLATHTRLVLEAPPGAGKTTQLPLALLDAPWLEGRKLLMLEPRRVAARAAAGFMAAQLGERVGETVGYRIRFDNKVSARTRIEVVTEGILTRMLQDDPLLEGIGAILFDEFHERHLASDLGLALALDVQASVRDDLRIVVMSATLDGESLSRWLDAPRISSAGRSFPVHVDHFAARRDEALEHQVKRAVVDAIAAHPGDVLVFLPGLREITAAQRLLEGALPGIDILALHGELPVEQQSRLLQPDADGRRRIVLATNVAESSLTLPGVRVVIDSGLAREPRFDPNSGFSRLDTVAIAQSSADQRAGRAGRVAEGHAYRLWPESKRLDPQRRPELSQVDLAALALELAAWGGSDLRFVDAPPPGTLASARDLLQRLEAITPDGHISERGRRMLALGTHPRLAAMLLSARDNTSRALACDLAALLEARDPLRSRSDALAERWQALSSFRNGRTPADANRSALAAIDAAAMQWRRRLRIDTAPPAQIATHELGALLAHAYPDRIARQHPSDPRRYQLSNGRGARLFDDSALYGEPWLVIAELRHEAREALILRALPVDERRLRADFAPHWRESDEVRWDTAKQALLSERIERFDGIVLSARPAGKIDPDLAAAALTEAVRESGLDLLPWNDTLAQWRIRVQCLHAWMPELALPDFSDAALLATLDDWLRPAFVSLRRIDALDTSALSEALRGLVDWSLRQRIDALAPTRTLVPSGLERTIEYALHDDGTPASPVLAVKLQELFGLAETPRIADGRIALTLHLLSPGGRPLQVTQDLRGFWDRTYPDVKKEMKGRYPRHPWPDDPWNATATHRAKPRGT
ncbi:ATP-dependent helicase HrpB [Solilutibacter silvestris]|uniref:ATP-dependent helicase HrpB n=1 Tax=Solilutibacter silvestris TaxID=1645665 RepID=A0A2K1Q1N3_9GAMM|nr:ATP-dependent helicase HrpB [Lysobacter silvestris]PNS08837.1 ATP-dependent helicase HrpB [Lysobacter silvestris]